MIRARRDLGAHAGEDFAIHTENMIQTPGIQGNFHNDVRTCHPQGTGIPGKLKNVQRQGLHGVQPSTTCCGVALPSRPKLYINAYTKNMIRAVTVRTYTRAQGYAGMHLRWRTCSYTVNGTIHTGLIEKVTKSKGTPQNKRHFLPRRTPPHAKRQTETTDQCKKIGN